MRESLNALLADWSRLEAQQEDEKGTLRRLREEVASLRLADSQQKRQLVRPPPAPRFANRALS